MNVNTNKRKADVKAEDDVQVEDFEIGNMNYRYIDNKYKDVIKNLFMYGLKKKIWTSQVQIIEQRSLKMLLMLI